MLKFRTIKIAQKLQKAQEIKQIGKKDILIKGIKTASVAKYIDYNALEKFIELVHNIFYLSKVSSFDILPDQLVCVVDINWTNTCHGSYKNSIQCSLMFYVFIETLLLTSSVFVKDKGNQVKIKNDFLFSMLDKSNL